MAEQQQNERCLYSVFSAGSEVMALTADERLLLRAFRMASPGVREAMSFMASDIIKRKARPQVVEQFDNVTIIGFVAP